LPYLWENCTSGDPLPEHPPGRAVTYTPFYRSQLRDTRAVGRVGRFAVPGRHREGRCRDRRRRVARSLAFLDEAAKAHGP